MGRTLNGLDAEELEKDVAMLKGDHEKRRSKARLTAEWVGGTRARVYSRSGREIFIGGERDFGGMSAALASFLGCEIDVIATHATLRGIELEKVTIEANGEFDLSRYMRVGEEPGPGYENIDYTVRIKAKNATREQLAELVKLCETASPVGDTMTRHVPLHLHVSLE